MDMDDDDDANRVHVKVGEMDPVDSGLMPGLFAEAEKRGFWLRVKNTNVSPSPVIPVIKHKCDLLPRILQFQSKTVVSLHPAGNLDWNKESIVEVRSNSKQQKIIILFRVLSPTCISNPVGDSRGGGCSRILGVCFRLHLHSHPACH